MVQQRTLEMDCEPCNVAQEGTGTNCTFSEVAASGAVVFWELYRTVYLAVWTVMK